MRLLLKAVLVIALFLVLVWGLVRFGNRELLLVVLCFSVSVPILYLAVDRFVQKNQLLSMKEEALRAELALLKNQINPHFFFNTLNNLYGLALEKSDATADVILRLSDLMRFTIYEGSKDRVFLRDEIAYLENYLAIQKIRIRTKTLTLRFEKEMEDDLVQVAPLMFIMLVENAFKHGVGSVAGDAWVTLRLKATSAQVGLEIENNFIPPANPVPPGIGLANLKRRLALLYPQRHDFSSQAEDGVFRARLQVTV